MLLAGGIATAQDLAHALEWGAAAAVAGSRFVLTHESGAHPAYKGRILGAPRTVLTRLFGVGWSCKHRVVPNAATTRWCDATGQIPFWVGLAQRGSERFIQPFAMLRDPGHSGTRTSNCLAVFYTPASLGRGQDAAGVEATALYAGESVARIPRDRKRF